MNVATKARNEWVLPNGAMMTLDGVEHRFHVRERDNRVAIVIHQPGWAAHCNSDYWYLSIEDLRPTGDEDEGQIVKRWEFRTVHRDGLTYSEAMRIGKEWYVREATEK